jgi:hypothetical protein
MGTDTQANWNDNDCLQLLYSLCETELWPTW